MATIEGTTGQDTLIGTADADLIFPYGVAASDGPDLISGLNGSDVYNLGEAVGGTILHRYIIDDGGTDGAVDHIVGAGDMVQSASLGYQAFATARRNGDDLVIVTPSKPHRFRDPAEPSYEITIVDHFAGNSVERMWAGGVQYRLRTDTTGSTHADLIAGTALADTMIGGAGDDYITGNEGADMIGGGDDNDMIFGGGGGDGIHGQTGNDSIYGGRGNDSVRGGDGIDRIHLEDGDDAAAGGDGGDTIYGQAGNDTVIGGAGQDRLSGGAGDDWMFGGLDGDTYVYGYDVDALGTLDEGGHDVIRDKGDTPSYMNYDSIELYGFYGPSSGSTAEAFARLSFSRIGNHMLIEFDNGAGSLAVSNQFGDPSYAIEELHFNAGYWTPLRFKILDGAQVNIGDDRRYDLGQGGEWNEILFGTDGNDLVFGDSGNNFIWLGGGADVLIYKESDPQLLYGNGGGAVNDIVMDFDLAEDIMDFREIGGLSMAALTIVDNANGDATIHWDSADFEISDVFIELRGVSAVDLTGDHFLFV